MVTLAQHLTTLKPGDPDDGDSGRQQRGIAIAALCAIRATKAGYVVPSQQNNGNYVVRIDDDDPWCSCPDFTVRRRACKHVFAVQAFVQRSMVETETGIVVPPDSLPAPDPRETVAMRQSYPRNWRAYNQAQYYEEEHFEVLLRRLCDTIPEPVQEGRGRPRLSLADMVYILCTKVYHTSSIRRSDTCFRRALRDGLVDDKPAMASFCRYLQSPELTPILEDLVTRSALPLKGLETQFAIDGTGFGTRIYDRWFDRRWGRNRTRAAFVKAQALVGTMTNVVVVAAATGEDKGEAPFLPPFVERASRYFNISEVSADMAYLSRRNLHAIDAIGASAYIPFKSNSRPDNGDPLWSKLFHEYHLAFEEFEEHYHRRSNVETTFSCVKARFRPEIMARKPVGQCNEVLLKFLGHNLCTLVRSAYEFDLSGLLDSEAFDMEPADGLRIPKNGHSEAPIPEITYY